MANSTKPFFRIALIAGIALGPASPSFSQTSSSRIASTAPAITAFQALYKYSKHDLGLNLDTMKERLGKRLIVLGQQLLKDAAVSGH
ncbi:hypothetical protein QFZ34_001183 [Phyllobacterium ifriqiyense]|uniref:Uncharacterized protein n=1 Tax=Phyllobacterium ifriqiyense TaxID=314238 RepID=A0ABU0S660_9HYPH|nr:hypothetical protein [Phyllobacterium ifriqiyense]MDQ0996006.1 hypothetical protein [Phyllobacterium ifriqiyense]